MKREHIKKILLSYKQGNLSIEEAIENLSYKELSNNNLIFARVDHSRKIRCGFPEVIFGLHKKTEDILKIVNSFVEKKENVLITKVDKDVYDYIKKHHQSANYNESAKIITISSNPSQEPTQKDPYLLIITGGTSDINIAEEAYVTANFSGIRVERLYDIGVAGIHRLLDQENMIIKASAIIVVAGMEGALASVIGGLVRVPLIAVPTSVGYGASFKGLSALLTMLNSCAPGVAVVNIDNGFGAGYYGAMIIQMLKTNLELTKQDKDKG
ncbi:MAG: nickel pincer cofactor biosynthesis protein LarB [bacterium]|nr:nickel pincer cofactor biosynthesis protein LarB [bacterium]